ncbi:RNAPII degradation factor [Rhizina undulata]
MASEVQQRPPPSTRGRGSSRGGRGGSSFVSRSGGSNRNAARNSNTNGDSSAFHDNIDDQGEEGQLKRQYASQLSILQEMFPSWTAEDIVFALNENHGDLDATAAKMAAGHATKWGEVKKKSKERSRPKVENIAANGNTNDGFQTATRPSRGARGGFEGARGGRGGRGGHEHRGGRGGRGRGGPANGAPRQSKDRNDETQTSNNDWDAPAETGNAWESSESKPADAAAWDDGFKHDADTNGWDTTDNQKTGSDAPKTIAVPKPKAPPAPPKTTWASLLKPAPPPPAPVQKKPPTPKQPVAQPLAELPASTPEESEPVTESLPPPRESTPEPPALEIEASEPEETMSVPEPEHEPEPEPEQPVPEPEVEEVVEPKELEAVPEQPLTEVNLEKIEDEVHPPPSTTQASTISPAPAITSTQPAIATPQMSMSRPVLSAAKSTPTRATPSRRVLDQQEGVVMPGNHGALDRATLQFGSMGLNGDIDDDDEIEQAETVSQPPQPSPIAQPVAALPPAVPQMPVVQPPVIEIPPAPTPRQAPGLPAQPHIAPQPSPQPPVAPQSMTQQHQQQLNPQLVNQYNNRYVSEQQQQQVKPFEAFVQPVQQPTPQSQHQQPQAQPQAPQNQPQSYGGYPSQIQPHQQQLQPSHLGLGVSSAPEQQYSYYTDRSQPPGFSYNSAYMQAQQAQAQQDAGAAQQRASSGLSGAGDAVQVPTSTPGPSQVQQATSRYGGQAGEQNSGHGTPSPAISSAQQTSQPHQPSLAQYPGMPYNAYTHPYYNQFMHQNYYNQPNPFTKHQGIYGYPQQAYMSPQYSDHSTSPAALSGFGAPSAPGRESMAGLGDYARMNASAAQQQQTLPQHTSAGGYGGGIPNFLNSRGIPQDQQQLGGAGVGQQQAVQQSQNDDALKYGENKPPTGPSGAPSLQGQPGRPGSATSGATNLGPQQGQAPAGMYGSHLNHNLHGHQAPQNQYGLGQQQTASPYSMYTTAGAYPNQYGQNSGRHTGGGWNYGH